MVELLFVHGLSFLDVEHSDEVGPLGVVFDQTGHSTTPLQPRAAAIRRIDLDHGRAERGAFPAQVAQQTLVLLRGEQDGAHVRSPARQRVAVHGFPRESSKSKTQNGALTPRKGSANTTNYTKSMRAAAVSSSACDPIISPSFLRCCWKWRAEGARGLIRACSCSETVFKCPCKWRTIILQYL